jgi:hypothetical protein
MIVAAGLVMSAVLAGQVSASSAALGQRARCSKGKRRDLGYLGDNPERGRPLEGARCNSDIGMLPPLKLSCSSCTDGAPHSLRGRRHFDMPHPRSASASTIALMTAASAGVVPPSPPERTPSLFVGEGSSLSAVAKNGTVSTRGIA